MITLHSQDHTVDIQPFGREEDQVKECAANCFIYPIAYSRILWSSDGSTLISVVDQSIRGFDADTLEVLVLPFDIVAHN